MYFFLSFDKWPPVSAKTELPNFCVENDSDITLALGGTGAPGPIFILIGWTHLIF